MVVDALLALVTLLAGILKLPHGRVQVDHPCRRDARQVRPRRGSGQTCRRGTLLVVLVDVELLLVVLVELVLLVDGDPINVELVLVVDVDVVPVDVGLV